MRWLFRLFSRRPRPPRPPEADFTIGDFISQLEAVTPTWDKASLERTTAIYNSMTEKERQNTALVDEQRRRRIALGAGVRWGEVKEFIRQFESTRDMMRAMSGMGIWGRLKMMHAFATGKLSSPGMSGGPSLGARRRERMEKLRNRKKRR